MKNLIQAMLEVQKELKNPKSDSKNPHFGNSFASLEAVIDATKPVLTKHGVWVSQPTKYCPETKEQLLETILWHSSGESLSASYVLRPTKEDPQQYGSALSYARRYCLLAILDLSDTDDDAAIASKPVHTPIVNTGNHTGPTEKQVNRLWAISKKAAWTSGDVHTYLDSIGIASVEELNYSQYEYLCKAMETYPKTHAS